MRGYGSGFAAGLALGANTAGRWVNAYYGAKDAQEAEQLKAGLADAGQANRVSEEVVGEDAQAKAQEIEQLRNEAMNQARDAHLMANPDDASGAEQAGLAAAKTYQPAVEEATRLGAKEAPGFVVGKDSFDSKAQATAAAETANTQGMADVYRAHGKPEQAMKLEAGGLQMKAARRENELGEKAQGLKLGDLENQYKLQEGEFRNKMSAQKVQGMDLMRAMAGHFADIATTNPALAEHAMKRSGFLDSFGATDADFVPGTKDGIAFTLKDGTKAQTTLSDLKTWAKGKEPLKYTVVGEGGMLVEQDGKGGVRTVASNPKEPKEENQRLLVKDAIDQVALAYGARMDPISKMIDTSTIQDPVGYAKAIEEGERRVRAGEKPMAVASDIALKARKTSEATRAMGKPGSTPSGGNFSGLWSSKK